MNCNDCRLYNTVNCWYCKNNSEYEPKENNVNIKIKKLSETATIPTYGTSYSMCCDIYSDENVCIAPHCRDKVHTGISLEIPEGYGANIYARSSIATKKGLSLVNGVGKIDSDYRGEVMCAFINNTDDYQYILQGDRIAQMEVVEVNQVQFEEVEELSETERGTGGFGSTGV